ncbi:unnamed protein product [Kluyveromyces dobzhanskii CBS 2104]|uniref:WGS project CCBQ000000000 data, contig 00098 n=1 Tax=Kluyveromyces dobzhanskii CBS 2104 TaxID=1427455 RepID=A0A0A8L3H5_9SACH|nr:unnamed protein product [Kluyveromyces dobzhanskii CBS 2104]
MKTMNTTNSQKDDTTEQIVPLPAEYLRCSRTHLVVIISRMLSFLIQINDAKNAGKDTMELTRFHSKAAPSITVYQYLIRLTKYSSLEHSVLLSAVYYIDLLSAVYPEFTLNSLTVHRFLLTATTIASKGLCDSFCTNTHYSKVGGVQCSELNILENEFLERVRYRILPRDDNIENCKTEQKMGDNMNMLLPTKSAHERGSNDGFNVLQSYYKKIVQLVGNPQNSPDKTSLYFFKVVDPIISHDVPYSVPPEHAIPRNSVKERANDNVSVSNHSKVTISGAPIHNIEPTSIKNGDFSNGQYSNNEHSDSPSITIPQKRNLKDDDSNKIERNKSVIRSGKKLASRFDS